MLNKKRTLFLMLFFFIFISAQGNHEYLNSDTELESLEKKYAELQKNLLKGWNTWDNRSIMTHVLLPEALALIMGIEDGPSGTYMEHVFTGNRVPGTEKVRTHAHTPDGRFTDFSLYWKNISIRVKSAAIEDDLFIWVFPEGNNNGILHLKSDILYNRKGEIKFTEYLIRAELPERLVSLHAQGEKKDQESANALIFDLNHDVFISTKQRQKKDIIEIINKAEQGWLQKKKTYGGIESEPAQVYSAIQNALNWGVVYDPVKDRAITPVARTWAYGWGKGEPGGYVLFCWDNFFAAWMHSIESKELAYNEAIQMCNFIDELGFVPNYAGPNNVTSRDRSQPPVGSMCIKKIYQRHPEKWFLQYNFDKLLRWNQWWYDNRVNDGLLTWGSDPFHSESGDHRELAQHDFAAASNESGLDNTPMYDGVKFDPEINMLRIQDVGLNGMYIMDCEALAWIADELGRTAVSRELRERADEFRSQLKPLWDEDFGLFLNRYTENNQLSKRISPTNFYALLGEAATQEQAETMINDHFYNPDEFWGEYILPSIARNDTAYTAQDYWRGSIWAPMNLLVYWGLQNYDLPGARKDLAEKSKTLLLKNWIEHGWVRENYHAETGGYLTRSEHFYHWGALLGMIYLIDEGYLDEWQ